MGVTNLYTGGMAQAYEDADTAFSHRGFAVRSDWLLANYGEEGFSWEYDENGNLRYKGCKERRDVVE